MNLQSLHELSKNETFLGECGRKAASWGISLASNPSKACLTKIMRISLVPRPFKKELYEKVVELGPIFNALVDRISRDIEWLIDSHRGLYQRKFS